MNNNTHVDVFFAINDKRFKVSWRLNKSVNGFNDYFIDFYKWRESAFPQVDPSDYFLLSEGLHCYYDPTIEKSKEILKQFHSAEL